MVRKLGKNFNREESEKSRENPLACSFFRIKRVPEGREVPKGISELFDSTTLIPTLGVHVSV